MTRRVLRRLADQPDNNYIQSPLFRYGLAIAATVAALTVRHALDPWLGILLPFVFTIPAIVLSCVLGGLGPGILSSLLSIILSFFLFVEPRHALPSLTLTNLIQVTGWIIADTLLCVIVESLRRTRRRGIQEKIRFRVTYDHAPVGIVQIALNGRLLDVNSTLCTMLGYPREELLKLTFTDITYPADLPDEQTLIQHLFTGKIPSYSLEKRYLRRDGQPFWARTTSSLAPSPRPYRISVVEDISARRRAEEALNEAMAEAERRAREAEEGRQIIETVMDHIPLGILVADTPEVKIRMVSRYGREMIGKTEAEVNGLTIDEHANVWKIFHADGTTPAAGDELPLSRVMRTGELIKEEEWAITRADGQLVPILCTAAPIRDAQGQIIGGVVGWQDITDRKREEEERGRLAAIVSSSQDAIFSKTVDGTILSWNKAAERMYGYTAEEMVGHHLAELAPTEQQEELSQLLERLSHGEQIEQYETERVRKDGRRIRVSLSISPIRDTRGRLIAESTIARDITRQYEAEQALRQNEDVMRKVNQQLAEADRRKDEFLAMLAHELRNPLAPIRYAVQMMNLKGPGTADLQKQRDVIERQVSHMGRLLDDLLDISRIAQGKIQLRRENLDLRRIAEQSIESMRPQTEGRQQHLAYQAPAAPIMVNGDPTRIEQVLRNLLTNATKYTEPGGCIELTIGMETANELDWRAVVRVSDSGIGIAPEMLNHIFEPFVQIEQSMARTQGGLGIGLSMVKRLVELHGGQVEAHSDGPGRGCEFIVRLPLAKAVVIGERPEASITAQQVAPTAVAESTRRVLVVDDNEDSAASLSELLGIWGHEVHTARDGYQALAATHQWRPEVILLDIGLPGMDGYEVARRLRQDPALAGVMLVALTGYGGEEDRRRTQEAGFHRHLTKPVELNELRELLRIDLRTAAPPAA